MFSMGEDYLIEDLSDSEIASFVPQEALSPESRAAQAEISYLRNKVETLEYEKYQLATEANDKVSSAQNQLIDKVSKLEATIAALETELQLTRARSKISTSDSKSEMPSDGATSYSRFRAKPRFPCTDESVETSYAPNNFSVIDSWKKAVCDFEQQYVPWDCDQIVLHEFTEFRKLFWTVATRLEDPYCACELILFYGSFSDSEFLLIFMTTLILNTFDIYSNRIPSRPSKNQIFDIDVAIRVVLGIDCYIDPKMKTSVLETLISITRNAHFQHSLKVVNLVLSILEKTVEVVQDISILPAYFWLYESDGFGIVNILKLHGMNFELRTVTLKILSLVAVKDVRIMDICNSHIVGYDLNFVGFMAVDIAHFLHNEVKCKELYEYMGMYFNFLLFFRERIYDLEGVIHLFSTELAVYIDSWTDSSLTQSFTDTLHKLIHLLEQANCRQSFHQLTTALHSSDKQLMMMTLSQMY